MRASALRSVAAFALTCDCCRYEFIKNNKFQGLTLSLIRRFALQMLVSLRYLKQEKVHARCLRRMGGVCDAAGR